VTGARPTVGSELLPPASPPAAPTSCCSTATRSRLAALVTELEARVAVRPLLVDLLDHEATERALREALAAVGWTSPS